MSPTNICSAIVLFAQDGGAAPPGGPPGGIIGLVIPFALIFAMFYFFMILPEKRKTAQHKSVLEALKKNDRVVTVGGIYGVVANVQREADRVTLKVDETNNTKIDVTFGAISRVLVADAEQESK